MEMTLLALSLSVACSWRRLSAYGRSVDVLTDCGDDQCDDDDDNDDLVEINVDKKEKL